MRPSEVVFEVHGDEEDGYYTAAVGYGAPRHAA